MRDLPVRMADQLPQLLLLALDVPPCAGLNLQGQGCMRVQMCCSSCRCMLPIKIKHLSDLCHSASFK
jgi:hypothetical protein